MIPKLDSNELNQILSDANKKADSTIVKIDNMKSDIEQKLMIMKHETEYTQDGITKLSSGMFQSSDMKALSTQHSNMQENYGAVVHSKFIKNPINVLNLQITGSGEVFFRSDIKATITGATLSNVKKYEPEDILRHESLPRGIFFDEFTSNTVSLKFEMAAITKLLGPTKFNMIELDPFLNGSFDITALRIYKLNTDGSYNATPDTYAVPKAGKIRIVLPEKISFYKVEMDVTINYSTHKNETVVYPFGLKHIYFYDADFRTDSYAMLTINSEENVAAVKETVKVKSTFGTIDTTMTEQKMIPYMDYANGSFSNPILTSTDNQLNVVPRNIKTFFIKIPLLNKALIGASVGFTTK